METGRLVGPFLYMENCRNNVSYGQGVISNFSCPYADHFPLHTKIKELPQSLRIPTGVDTIRTTTKHLLCETLRMSARFFRLGLVAALLAYSPAAHATPAEARAVAIVSNCKPGKVEPLREITGVSGETVYKVACTGGKAKDQFVLVQCRVRQCVLLR
jgi:hypothetical protein